jgi:bifunctional oligoribonuclease and PAP phosphatase NrnA
MSLLDCSGEAFAMVRALLEARTIVVASHVNPDGDALGSSCGLGLSLQHLGKEVTFFNESPLPRSYSFIPGFSQVVRDIPPKKWDAVVVCDSASSGRVGDTSVQTLLSSSPVYNIDHHISNERFGSLNYVVPEASSTCEVLVPVIGKLLNSSEIPSAVATALLTGIVSDTGSFRYRSTTADTLEVAAHLVRCGALLSEITTALFSQRSLNSVKLHAYAMSRIALYAEDLIAFIVVDEDAYHATGSQPEDTEGLAEEARDIAGVEIGVLIRWEERRWRVSLRAKSSSVDLSTIAGRFGGGGHKAAAAFRSSAHLSQLHRDLLTALTQAL